MITTFSIRVVNVEADLRLGKRRQTTQGKSRELAGAGAYTQAGMRIITFTTDFGTADWFVGTMKGVIRNIHPRAAIVDITQGIPAGDIRAGAFALAASYNFFPRRTIHVAIVDPGVGGPRRAIAVRTTNYSFVGPDNGVLSFALAKERIQAIHQLTNKTFFRKPVSQTFHGRDIFAPVAAYLSKGLSLHRLGPELKSFVRLPWPEPQWSGNAVRGEIIYIDHFGNAITNISRTHLAEFTRAGCQVFIRRKRSGQLATFYQAVRPGKAVAVVGSSDLLEIAVNGGSAARRFQLGLGDAVTVRPSVRHAQSSS
jgi:S-adenosylmethionine hydrolase